MINSNELRIDGRVTHGLTNHPLYKVLEGIISRCYKTNVKQYVDYGARGITVYDEWRTCFKVFYDWSIDNGWKAGLEIDRIDNSLGYFPFNCRFVTGKINCRNRRTNRIITYKGKSQTLIEWSEETGITYHVLHSRLKCNWPIETLFNAVNSHKYLEINGESKTITEWATFYGIAKETVNERYRKGIRGDGLFYKGNIRSYITPDKNQLIYHE